MYVAPVELHGFHTRECQSTGSRHDGCANWYPHVQEANGMLLIWSLKIGSAIHGLVPQQAGRSLCTAAVSAGPLPAPWAVAAELPQAGADPHGRPPARELTASRWETEPEGNNHHGQGCRSPRGKKKSGSAPAGMARRHRRPTAVTATA